MRLHPTVGNGDVRSPRRARAGRERMADTVLHQEVVCHFCRQKSLNGRESVLVHELNVKGGSVDVCFFVDGLSKLPFVDVKRN